MSTSQQHSLPGFDAFARVLTRVEVPAEDRRLSPYTGLTRDHWLAAADDLLLSAARYRSPGGARIDLPGPVSQQGVRTDGLEGFARTFLLAAFRHAGTAAGRGAGSPETDPHGHLDRYLEGVVSGTRHVGRDGADSWPVVSHIGRHGQPHVEAACIALSLHLTKAASWDRLSPGEQDRLDDWLRFALRHEPASHNWYLFPLTITSFLEGVGRADQETGYVIERGIGLIDQWYRGEGWYSDGDGQAFDHYIGWALHMYPLLHSRLRGETDLERRLGARLKEFLGSFALTFDRNGAPLHYGRSLTYRTGTLASIALGEVFDATPLRHGQSRQILSANLRYFLERGATDDGILTLGWHGPHPPTVQRYSGPGSPYWASKGFAALLLPADHPLWTSEEETPNWEHHDQVRAVSPAGLLVQRTARDGLVRVHNHGSDHIKPHQGDSGAPDPLYGRFAYSTGPVRPVCTTRPTTTSRSSTGASGAFGGASTCSPAARTGWRRGTPHASRSTPPSTPARMPAVGRSCPRSGWTAWWPSTAALRYGSTDCATCRRASRYGSPGGRWRALAWTRSPPRPMDAR